MTTVLDKMKARLGSLSFSKLEEIKEISPSTYQILIDLPLVIDVVEVAYEVDCSPNAVNIRDLTDALDKLESEKDGA
jgi:hypothetical protein